MASNVCAYAQTLFGKFPNPYILKTHVFKSKNYLMRINNIIDSHQKSIN